MSDLTTFLMYHELAIPGRELAMGEPGYVRYCVALDAFQDQMHATAARGLRGASVSEWADAPANALQVVITFDDGCETDLIAAAPILKTLGFNATCYLTVDFLGRRGFLTRPQALALAETGIEIGCHSLTHPHLNDLDDASLPAEIIRAKGELEQLCGVRVRSFSCPGGRYDARVLRLAADAGYDTVCTSRAVQNTHADPRNQLGRVAVMDDTSITAFAGMLSGEALRSRQRRDATLGWAKRILGNRLYEGLRGRLLR